MSEQLDPTTDPLREDDPLVELARIVSGEDVDAPEEQEISTTQVSSPATDEFSTDLEAELMRELGGPEVDPQPAPSDELVEPVAAEQPAAANQSGDGVFHDELLQALQDEVQSPKPESDRVDTSEVIDAKPVTQSSEASALEVIAQTAAPENISAQSTQQEPVTAAKDPSADLGSAFAAEFEQMIKRDGASSAVQSTEAPPAPATESQQSANAATIAEEQVSEQFVAEQSSEQAIDVRFAASTEAVREELSQEADEAPIDPNLDIESEFGAAFAQELGMDSLPAEQGWDSNQPVETEQSFVPENTTLSGGVVTDPGHADDLTDTQMSGGRGGKRYAVAALSIALVAGLGAAGYGFFDGSASVDGASPIIKADTDPVKIKPEDPGGRQVANQDKASYEKVADTGAESNNQDTLISNTEEPADLVALAEPKSDERLTADTAEPEPESTAGIEPRKVRTVTVKPDGTILLPESVDALPSTSSLALASSETLASTETAAIEESVGIDGAKSSLDLAVPSLSPVPKPDTVEVGSTNVEEAVEITPVPVEPVPEPVEPVEVAAASSTSEGVATSTTQRSEWAVQVSSQRSPEAAQASYQNLRNRFGSIFEGRSMAIQRAVIEDKGTFYRVRIQTASKSDATQFCSKFKASGGSCFVTR